MPTDEANDTAACLVMVRGALGSNWADYLGEMAVFTQATADQAAATILSGQVADFAAFVGLLGRLQNLGLPVQMITFQQLPARQPG